MLIFHSNNRKKNLFILIYLLFDSFTSYFVLVIYVDVIQDCGHAKRNAWTGSQPQLPEEIYEYFAADFPHSVVANQADIRQSSTTNLWFICLLHRQVETPVGRF